MISILKVVTDWLVYSSSNPEKLSRTFKSALLMAAPIAMYYLGVDQNVWGELVSDFTTFVSMLFTAVFFLIKVVNTIRALTADTDAP